RRGRKVEPGDEGAVTREDQRVEAKMALQVDEPRARDIAQFAALDRVQLLLAGEKPLDRVEPAAIAAVDGHPLVPIAPVGGDEFNATAGHRENSWAISVALCAANGLA